MHHSMNDLNSTVPARRAQYYFSAQGPCTKGSDKTSSNKKYYICGKLYHICGYKAVLVCSGLHYEGSWMSPTGWQQAGCHLPYLWNRTSGCLWHGFGQNCFSNFGSKLHSQISSYICFRIVKYQVNRGNFIFVCILCMVIIAKTKVHLSKPFIGHNLTNKIIQSLCILNSKTLCYTSI